MQELSRYLFLAGALPYLLLGTAHALHTPGRPDQRKGLSPSDPALAETMTRSRVLLTGRTDMWRAWVGFNLSHSLGAVLFGVAVALLGVTPTAFGHNAPLCLPFAVAGSVAYLSVGIAYWFRTPIIGIALSVVLFSSAWVLSLVGRQ